MSLPIASSLSELLGILKKQYLVSGEQNGGTAEGFRGHVRKLYSKHLAEFNALVPEALMEATTKKWQQAPRKTGPDLFAVNGLVIPEYLTRSANGYADGEDIEDDNERVFEKVDHQFATVGDLYEDATITLRKGAQTSTKGERKMQAADEARRRARGRMEVFLKDIAD